MFGWLACPTLRVNDPSTTRDTHQDQICTCCTSHLELTVGLGAPAVWLVGTCPTLRVNDLHHQGQPPHQDPNPPGRPVEEVNGKKEKKRFLVVGCVRGPAQTAAQKEGGFLPGSTEGGREGGPRPASPNPGWGGPSLPSSFCAAW